MNNSAMKTIFTIDLLKGQSIPLQSGAAGMAVAFLTAALPVMVAIAIIGLFMWNRVVMSLTHREIKSLEAKTSKFADAIEFQRAIEMEKVNQGLYLSEVKSKISKFNQWSPIVAILAENMPPSVALTELEVKQDSIKKKIPNKDNPKEMIEINVPVTTMRLKMSDSSLANNDDSVRVFRDYLRTSPVLGPMLEKVEIYNKETSVVDGQDVAFYLMDCTFKSGA
jgi:hypothetical protein